MSPRGLPPPGRTWVMAVLNLTPDSFSDGGRLSTPEQALAAGLAAVADGAALLDLGAASTRPGAAPVPPDEEWARLAPVLGPLRAAVDVPLSLDTTSARVLERALELGVDLLNDTSALADDPLLGPLAAEAGLPVVLMHRRGTPADMQLQPHYDHAPTEVRAELREALERGMACGLRPEQLLLDPGIGFGKRVIDNLDLLLELPDLVAMGHRTVLGCSRKSFLGAVSGAPVERREHATTVTTVLAAQAGVDFVRVHDVAAASQALALVGALAERSAARQAGAPQPSAPRAEQRARDC